MNMAQMYESYMYKSVDNFDLSMMNGNVQENGEYMNVDHTFHTPSFGDEEFDIPPINLPPTTPSSDTNSSDVYGSTQPLSHQEQSTQPQQSPNNNQQQHIMSPPPQMSPSPCSQSGSGMERIGAIMTTVTTAPSPPTMMTSFSGSPHHQHQHHHSPHMLQQQQQQQQQQQHYGNPHPGDMYMLQIAPGNMIPQQSVQFHVQQYAIPTSYPNGPMPQSHLHMEHAQHQQQQHLHQVPQHHNMGIHPHHPSVHPQHHHQQLLPPSPMLALQLGGPRHQRPGSVGSSPPGSNHTSPGLETSEDSDDSGHLSQLMCGMKRPSPEPVERPPSVGKPIKKPKVQKKKKKRDPNEPQKPVSAYALFFRDTQAAIKGQNPNASFGEVSKIVASMWDGLDIDHKNVYKKKTEAAKKEYLKALAAYRASLVSKAANDQSDNIYGTGSTPTSMSSAMNSMPGQALSPLQKKSPLLTSLMEGNPVSNLQNMSNSQSLIMGQGQMNGGHHPHMMQQHMSPHSSAPSHQMLHQMLSPGPPQQQMMHMGSPPPQHVMQQHPGMQHLTPINNNANSNNNNISYPSNMSQQMQHPGQQPQQQGGMMCASPLQNSCSRGDTPQEWDRGDYCNNDCVVSHCRDVFTTWVAARPPQNSYASVK
ncbi:thymocyte selection-associated high mobility group box protein TOX isoform X2 [Parasteatoda tepidariorum]|uniref:thymocyte selection-associated high mobility group box protein TOX isoform X2 n=1 Tax=Parasteatoda tepidariorum TaxID=114398 RepID=UPI001C721648|nr:thymocyte selection-associated high mobility group box protein TOX isoform X3 [Parasteatoda tepidariorum]